MMPTMMESGSAAVPQHSIIKQDNELEDQVVYDDEAFLEGNAIMQSNNRSCRRPRYWVASIVAVVVVMAILTSTIGKSPEGAKAQESTKPSENSVEDPNRGDSDVSHPKSGKTQAPAASPSSIQPTSSPSRISLGCLPDRFDNEEMALNDPVINFNKLYPGQFICSKPYKASTSSDEIPQRYRFGMATSGDVIWQDTVTNETKVVFANPGGNDNTVNDTDLNLYFSLRIDATMVVQGMDNNPNDNNISADIDTDTDATTILWEAPAVNARYPIAHTPRCLPTHDCPYFHLHSDGVLVLNYIAGDGNGWQARNIFRAYDIE